MKVLYYVMLITILGTACKKELVDVEQSVLPPNMGVLSLNTIEIETSDIPIITKSAPDFSILDKENFIIRLYNEDGSEYKGGTTDANVDGTETTIPYNGKTLKELREIGMPLLFPVGNYTVKAFSYDSAAILVDKPYFMGENTFTIEEHMENDVLVTCHYASVGVEVRLSADFLSFFKDNYKIVVSNSLGDTQTYDKDTQSVFYFTRDCDYLKIVVQCESKDNLVYNPRSYYYNKDGNDPQFDGDGPYKGEHFIININASGEPEIIE